MFKKAWIGLIIMILLTPIGLLASNSAWGEWGIIEIKQRIGFVPQGMNRFQAMIRSLFPDYVFPGLGRNYFQSAMGYILSAVIGISAIILFFWLLGKLIPEKKS
jgi:hypothetical protein